MSNLDVLSSSAKRIKLSRKELEELSKEDIIERWAEREQYVADIVEVHRSEGQKENMELLSLRESEDKLRQQQLEATRRENLLVMRLAAKEQEMQDYANQIQELKQAQIPGSSQLRSTLLDPAVNLMLEHMKKELNATKAKLEETQNELSAWKFTPDSNTGKRLMAKCRLLYQENEELGKMISSGRMAKLEGDLALQKNFSEEMKKSQAELDEFLLELDEDVEGMQSTILYLQQQLRDAKEHVARLQTENRQLQALSSAEAAPPETLCSKTARLQRAQQPMDLTTDGCRAATTRDDRTPAKKSNSLDRLANHTPPEPDDDCGPLLIIMQDAPVLVGGQNGGGGEHAVHPEAGNDRTEFDAPDFAAEEELTHYVVAKGTVQEQCDWTAADMKPMECLEAESETQIHSCQLAEAEWVTLDKSDGTEIFSEQSEELVIANGTADSISSVSNEEM